MCYVFVKVCVCVFFGGGARMPLFVCLMAVKEDAVRVFWGVCVCV